MTATNDEQPAMPVDPAVRTVVREVEAHAAASGWDQGPRLFALVPTTELLAAEPVLAAQMGIDAGTAAGSLTPIEQEDLPVDRSLEDALAQIMWPPQVVGCAAVVERVVLPPSVESELPEETGALSDFAANHPDRQEVRMAAAVMRDGRAHCALRLRAYDRDDQVLEGPEVVSSLVRLLAATLED